MKYLPRKAVSISLLLAMLLMKDRGDSVDKL
jgi:hypothetical protein